VGFSPPRRGARDHGGLKPSLRPSLSHVLEVLRAEQAPLQRCGIASLWVFGSVVRGDAHAGSDVDLFAEFDPDVKLSHVRLSSLRAELEDLLSAPVDLVERSTFHPEVSETAERDAVQVF
jgi:predicted nucleotidyltransferase